MFSDRIKELRTKTGLSQGDFAKKINSSVNSISRYELGKGNPQKKVIERICEVFGVSEEWLMGDKPLADDFALPTVEVKTTPKKKPGRKKKMPAETAPVVEEEAFSPTVDEEEAVAAVTEEMPFLEVDEEEAAEDIIDVDDEDDEDSPTIEVEINVDEEEDPSPTIEIELPDEEEEPEIEIEITVDDEEEKEEQAEPEPEKSSSTATKISNRVREIADQFADILGTVLEKAKPETTLSLTLESADGRQFSYAALVNKVHTVAPDATQAYIKPNENKIYYVTPTSAGSIDLF